jgi:hypothetical protein
MPRGRETKGVQRPAPGDKESYKRMTKRAKTRLRGRTSHLYITSRAPDENVAYSAELADQVVYSGLM